MKPNLISAFHHVGRAFSREFALSAILASMIPLISTTPASAGTIRIEVFEVNGDCHISDHDAAPPGVDMTFPCGGNTVSVRGIFVDRTGLVLEAKIEGSSEVFMDTNFSDNLTLGGAPPGTRVYLRMTLNITGSGRGWLQIDNPWHAECGSPGFPFFQFLPGPAATITADIPFCSGQPPATSQLDVDLFMLEGDNYTLRLTAVEVLDENKQHLPGGTVTSASGLVYPTGAVDPSAQIEAIEDAIEVLEVGGTISRGVANSLSANLGAAMHQVDHQPHAAVNMLTAFIHQVTALVRTRRLSVADGTNLTTAAENLIADLTN